MSNTGTYVYRDGRMVKVTEKPPLRGTPDMAVKSFRDQAMYGYRRVEEKGQRFLGKRSGIEKVWNRAAGLPV
jgi:hypothetical protein